MVEAGVRQRRANGESDDADLGRAGGNHDVADRRDATGRCDRAADRGAEGERHAARSFGAGQGSLCRWKRNDGGGRQQHGLRHFHSALRPRCADRVRSIRKVQFLVRPPSDRHLRRRRQVLVFPGREALLRGCQQQRAALQDRSQAARQQSIRVEPSVVRRRLRRRDRQASRSRNAGDPLRCLSIFAGQWQQNRLHAYQPDPHPRHGRLQRHTGWHDRHRGTRLLPRRQPSGTEARWPAEGLADCLAGQCLAPRRCPLPERHRLHAQPDRERPEPGLGRLRHVPVRLRRRPGRPCEASACRCQHRSARWRHHRPAARDAAAVHRCPEPYRLLPRDRSGHRRRRRRPGVDREGRDRQSAGPGCHRCRHAGQARRWQAVLGREGQEHGAGRWRAAAAFPVAGTQGELGWHPGHRGAAGSRAQARGQRHGYLRLRRPGRQHRLRDIAGEGVRWPGRRAGWQEPCAGRRDRERRWQPCLVHRCAGAGAGSEVAHHGEGSRVAGCIRSEQVRTGHRRPHRGWRLLPHHHRPSGSPHRVSAGKADLQSERSADLFDTGKAEGPDE